jgi:inosose dehydratase
VSAEPQGARFSCQTYAWQLSGGTYTGQLPRFVRVAASAGFQGLEPEPVMLGTFREAAAAHREIDPSEIRLSSIAFVAPWRDRTETDEERAEADHFIEFVRSFEGARIVLVQAPGTDREDLAERQANALACINAVAAREADAGVVSTFHPNSPRGSVFRTREDYEILLAGLDERIVNYTPDVGHIARGGMDPLDIVRTFRERIDHIHLKDFDSHAGWTRTGEGAVDFAGVVQYLHDTEFDGWIVVEDESPAAVQDPDAVTRGAGRYVREVLAPIVAGTPRASTIRGKS